MAITSELIGKLGGADVEVIPVELSIPNGGSKSFTLTHIEVPPGKRVLVNIQGSLKSNLTGYGEFRIGGGQTPFRTDSPGNFISGSLIVEESDDLVFYRDNPYNKVDFSGKVYTVEM